VAKLVAMVFGFIGLRRGAGHRIPRRFFFGA
jgi:hypothetical protein